MGRSRQNGERLRPPALPRRRVRGVARSAGPFVPSRSFSSVERAGTRAGRVSAAAVASELYPQIKKRKKEEKEKQGGKR